MAGWRGACTARHIPHPPQAVWDRLSDLERVPEWVFLTSRMKRISGPAMLGTTYDEVGPFGPSSWTITEWDPPRFQVHEGRLLGMRYRLEFTVHPEQGGARFTQHIMTVPWMGTVSWPVLKLFTAIITAALRRHLRD